MQGKPFNTQNRKNQEPAKKKSSRQEMERAWDNLIKVTHSTDQLTSAPVLPKRILSQRRRTRN